MDAARVTFNREQEIIDALQYEKEQIKKQIAKLEFDLNSASNRILVIDKEISRVKQLFIDKGKLNIRMNRLNASLNYLHIKKKFIKMKSVPFECNVEL